MLHAKDEGRIKYERICSVDGKPVPWDEIVKGYEYEKGEYVVLTDEDFKKVNPEATQSVDILEFVDLDKINPMFFDKPYYLEPSKQGKHAYALLREALTESNKVAIARVVDPHQRIHRRGQADRRCAGARADALGERDRADRQRSNFRRTRSLPEGEMKMARMLIDTMSVDRRSSPRSSRTSITTSCSR